MILRDLIISNSWLSVELTCHCLYEMTYMGFNQKEISYI